MVSGARCCRSHAHERHDDDRRSRGDAGETLLELLVAIVIISIGVVALLGGLLVATRSSTQVQGYSAVQATLRSYGEALSTLSDSGGPNPYTPCQTTSGYPSPAAMGVTPAPGVTVSVTAVQYWNGSGFASAAPCVPGTSDQGIQKVTLTATRASTQMPAVSRTIQVVLRRPCAVVVTPVPANPPNSGPC